MGVEGVAYATIISQGTSALLTISALLRSDSCVRIFPAHLRIHRDLLGRIVRIGLPSAIQMSISSFSNIFVNSYTYQFGADTMSGWASYSKIFQLFILPSQSLGAATSTFVGQNLGKGDMNRAKEGVRTAIRLSFLITIPLLTAVWLIAPHLVTFFNKKEEVVALGTLFIRLQVPFLVFVCLDGIYLPALRGSGNSKIPTTILLLCYPAFRQVYLFIMSNYISNTLIPIVLAYPLGWILCAIVSTIYYKKVGLSTVRLEQPQK
jgi:Na+-driven multidrug efflux pump